MQNMLDKIIFTLTKMYFPRNNSLLQILNSFFVVFVLYKNTANTELDESKKHWSSSIFCASV